jgi:hypothetical protein
MRFLSQLFQRAPTPAVSPRRSFRPTVENLEQRDVPTVVFNSAFGAETVSGPNAGMISPRVNLIFSGSYWNTTTGKQDEARLLNSARNILDGPYLSGLTQYGSDGHAIYNAVWNETGTVPSNPSTGDMQGFLWGSIGKHLQNAPGFNDWRHAPIYVVVSDPASARQDNGGWNAPGVFFDSRFGFFPPVLEDMHMIWVGTSTQTDGRVWKDAFTGTLSHELAEVMSDPHQDGIHVSPPTDLPSSIRGDNQIGDNEPAAQRYGYRLNGDRVQPYWSRADAAFIVPDGNKQKFVLNPIWSGATFTNQYDLFAFHDWSVGPETALHYGNGMTWAALNSEVVLFDPGVIRSVSTHTVYGAIEGKYVDLANQRDAFGRPVQGLLGLPTSDEVDARNSSGQWLGRVSHFAGGDIYWSAPTGAHVVYGGIRDKYNQSLFLHDVAGRVVKDLLGLPTSDELNLPGVAGARVNYFQGGEIVWSAAQGAHVIYGLIGVKYADTANQHDAWGRPVQALLGTATSDEVDVPGVPGARVSHFEHGDIFWSPATGAHVLYGGIRDEWLSLGGATSWLGLPTTDELAAPDGLGVFPKDAHGRVSYFQHGRIYWSPSTGASLFSGYPI